MLQRAPHSWICILRFFLFCNFLLENLTMISRKILFKAIFSHSEAFYTLLWSAVPLKYIKCLRKAYLDLYIIVHCPITDSRFSMECTRILDIQCSVNILKLSRTGAPTQGSYIVIVDLMPTYYTPCGRWLFPATGSKALVTNVNSSVYSYLPQYCNNILPAFSL